MRDYNGFSAVKLMPPYALERKVSVANSLIPHLLPAFGGQGLRNQVAAVKVRRGRKGRENMDR
jgi:hypothetical protein